MNLSPTGFTLRLWSTLELDQRIDVVDRETSCAYEFKVSGKNAASEFYKGSSKNSDDKIR